MPRGAAHWRGWVGGLCWFLNLLPRVCHASLRHLLVKSATLLTGDWAVDTHAHLHEKQDARVGHGVGQAQDPAAHDGVAQVEGGHPEGRGSRVLVAKCTR